MISDALAQKVTHYVPDEQELAKLHDVPIVLLSAISGTGKNAIIRALLKRHPETYRFVLSHTTRSPRANNGVMEQEGIEYHFIGFKEAEQLIDSRQYVEANFYSGNIYGTTIGELLMAYKEGKIAINEIEVQGADDFARLVPTVRTVFIVPPSYEEWQRRLKTRYGDRHGAYNEDLRRRIVTAKMELENVLQSNHFYLVVNDDLEEAAERVHRIARGEESVKRQPKAEEIAQTLLDRLEAEE